MSLSLNRVTLIGHLGADPEVRYTQDGRLIINMRIATSDVWKDKSTGERREKTEWHRVVIFADALAKTVQKFLKKGSRVFVEGHLQTRKWQGQDGNDRYTTEVAVQNFTGNVIALDASPSSRGDHQGSGGDHYSQDYGNASGGGNESSENFSSNNVSLDDDEIPF